jgi:hypothetical protein
MRHVTRSLSILALATLPIAGCVDPAPFIPEGSTSGPEGSSGSEATTVPDLPDVPPHADDDRFCLDPAVTPVLELAAPGLLANDGPAGARVEAQALPTLLGGNVTLFADGGLRYEPPPGIWGPDTFAYSVVDDLGRRAGATAHIDVRPTSAALARVADGALGLVLEGDTVGDRAGTRVAGLGDVNGDGVPDLALGAHLASHAGAYAGRSYVVLGGAEPGIIALADLSVDPRGWWLDGQTARDVAGWSLAGPGDVDGDGLADVLVGAPWVDAAACPGTPPFEEGCSQGRAYVALGQRNAISRSLSDVADGSAGFALDGAGVQWFSGSSIAGVRDLDGDGLAEILVGSPAVSDDVGHAHLVRGAALVGALGLDTVGATTPGFAMTGQGLPGQRVAAVGDVDGDGLEDLAIADHDAQGGTGVVHVVFGKLDDAPVDLDALARTGAGFTITGASAGDRTGLAIAGLGDVNGDGLDDLALGAPGPESWDWPTGGTARAGRVYVVHGKTGAGPVSLVDVDGGQGGLVLRGEPESAAGFSLASVADWNGDGLRDLLIGAPASSASGTQAGRVYVVFGGGLVGPSIELADVAAGHGGFALDGLAPWDQLGYAVGDAGDLDGDDLHELLLGAPGHGANTLNHALGLGRAYVLPGIPLPGSGAACED